MRTGHKAPETLVITGDSITELTDVAMLSERLTMPVDVLQCPDLVHLENPELTHEALLKEYSLGLGTLIALYHRHTGSPSVAPALRQKTPASLLTLKHLTKKLIVINALLLVALLVSLSVAQKIRLNVADQFVSESKPLVATMDKLQEEVDILKYEDGQRRPVLAVLMALSEILPSELKVESINMDRKGKLVITGTTKSVEAVSDNILEAIKESPLFKNPEFGGATVDKQGFGFTLSCELSARMQGAGK